MTALDRDGAAVRYKTKDCAINQQATLTSWVIGYHNSFLKLNKMKIERKYSNGGCMKSGMTLAALIIIIIWLCVTVIGCTTQKEGCPDSARWEAKTKFTK